uniref:Receptor-type tyrosine-protein phosphatase C n=1 Tax=Cyprinus carpio TaxID=7962 RepID=A0A8C2JR75_CYPCA
VKSCIGSPKIYLLFSLVTVLSPTSTSEQDTDTKVTGSSNSPTIMQSATPTPALPTGKANDSGKCHYNLTQSENEANVHINGSSNHTYQLKLMNKQEGIVFEAAGSSPLQIPFKKVKPCTNYTVTIDGCQLIKDPLNFNGNKSQSAYLKGEEKVCFKDGKWNLSKCINITDNDSCVQKPIHIELDTCSYTMKVRMPPGKPNINFSETIPTKFVWNDKPSKCNETMKINCFDDKEYDLGEDVYLEPSKKYNCAGQYKYYNKFINRNKITVNINCDWENKTEFYNVTSNLINISWILSPGDKCKGITWDSFSATKCRMQDAKTAVCQFDKLHAFTTYNCTISAEVNKSIGHYPNYYTSFVKETESSNPVFRDDKIKVKKTSHNSFTVECKDLHKEDWNGPKGKYIAELISYRPTVKEENETSCFFIFENLYYHTEYTFKVFIYFYNNDKALIGFLVFLILVTSLALLFVLYKLFLLKRKRSVSEPLRRVEPIYAGGLVEAYKNKIADEGRLFMDEFQILLLLRAFPAFSLIIPSKKQRNRKTSPRTATLTFYDYNRVTLSTGGEDNYINASFIEGYREPKKYIAAQGPKDETVVDFWRMVWEQKSSIIVMVTRCEEGNKTKCAQYWPSLDRETEIFEDFVVKIRSEEHCPDYVIRHLILNNKREKGSEREVTHIQFISWPDHGVPGDPSLLLKLRRRVNSFKNFFSGPVVVHCSAGVGRTGTYMSIDAMIESLEAEGRVDIYGFVAKLRRQRCLMVQVEAQYILIHTALIEYNQFGETEVSLSEFHSVLNTLRQKNGSDPSLLEKEFQKLPKFKKWRTMNTGSSEDNKKKNRDSAVIPYDFNRVIFRLDIEGNQTSDPEDEEEYSSDEEEESNQYINASFIDGYWCNKSLIAAQGPLPSTAEEFLLMLYQQQTKTLVMLTDCQEDGKDYCFQYWGDEKKTYGDMEIEVKKTETFPTYVRRHLEIQSLKKKEVLKVDQYQFLKWRGRELPENAQELVEMASIIRENGHYDNSKTNRNVPIVVHCNNGSSRTGIFCALWNLLDSAYTEKLVDVLQEVKNLRKLRQGMVETIEQYQFLYTALEGAFPVQNGAVKTPPAKDAAQVINETTALLTEPNSTSGADQKEAEESTAAESNEQGAKESSTAEAPAAEGDGEKATSEGPTNGPTATVEV